MESSKLRKLKLEISESQRSSNDSRALRLILSNIDKLEDNAVLREGIAITLAQLGEKKDALEILEGVGFHYANIGRSMRAIAVAKQIRILSPESTSLSEHIAAIYNIRSSHLDANATVNLAEPLIIDLEGKEPQAPILALMKLAAERGKDANGVQKDIQKLPPISFLSSLPENLFYDVLDRIEYSVFDKHEVVVEKGGLNKELIWSVNDRLVVKSDEGTQGLPPGCLIGLSSFGESSRASRIDLFAPVGSEVLRLSRASIAELSATHSDFENRLSTLRRHSMTERLLRRHPLFGGLSDKMRVAVIETFTGIRVSEGESVISQDESSPGLFIILDGEIEIVKNTSVASVQVSTLRSGDVFGEAGLITNQPAQAACVMTKAGHLLHLPRADFSALVARYPSVAEYTANLADTRLNEISSIEET